MIDGAQRGRRNVRMFLSCQRPLYSLLKRIVESERESGALAALRDTLLPKLIFGELRVRQAEVLVEREL